MSESGTGTLGKAMDVVEAIASAPGRLRFRDLLDQVGQPKGTLHRQIANLIDEGLIEIQPDQTYGLGVRLLRLAARSWSASQFRLVADPHLRQLHLETRETVHLGVLSGHEVIYLDKMESVQTVRMHSQIGNASPCYCTGVGKAALSAMDDVDLTALIKAISFKRFTPSTIPSSSALHEEITHIRQRGIAFDAEEHEQGIHCIAAPIHNPDRSFVAGVSVTAPVYRIDRAHLESWAPLIIATADAIMDDMTVRMGPKS